MRSCVTPSLSRYPSTQAIRSRLELRLTVSKPTSAARMSLLLCTFMLGPGGSPSCIAHRADQGGVSHGWLSPARHVFNVRVRRKTPMPDIQSLTAAELLRLYRRRELSPVEV